MAATATGATGLERVAPTTWQRNFNLARELAWTQFKLKYTGSVLGYVWSLVKPLMLFSIMYAIFVVFFKQQSNEFPLQLLVGIVFFTFFTDCTSAAMVALAGNAGLLQKAYFPRWILIIASSMTATMTFLINLTLIIIIATPLGHLHLSLRSFAVIPILAELYVLALGLAFLLSTLFVFYRDLGHIWEISTQVLFYASAIVYPVSRVPARFVLPFFINPLAQIIEDVRHALVTSDAPWSANVVSQELVVKNPVTQQTTTTVLSHVGPFVLVPIGICIAFLVVGVLVFRRLSPVVAENI